MQRDTQSKFLNDLTVSKRGMVKVASSQVPKGKDATSKHDVKKVLRTFEKSPDVSKKTLTQYQQRNELDPNSKQVAQDFFKDLGDARKHKKQMHLTTAMSLRQVGIFKIAGRDVYEDLETGDFWKISEDKKHVMRLFKENDKGVSDKKASSTKEDSKYRQNMIDRIEGMCGTMTSLDYNKMSTEDLETLYSGCIRRDPKLEEKKSSILTADTEDKYYEVSYEDATGRKGSISLFAESPEDAKNNVEEMLKASVGGKTLQVQTTNAPQIASKEEIEKEAKMVSDAEFLKKYKLAKDVIDRIQDVIDNKEIDNEMHQKSYLDLFAEIMKHDVVIP
jgi:hypothetical protein